MFVEKQMENGAAVVGCKCKLVTYGLLFLLLCITNLLLILKNDW